MIELTRTTQQDLQALFIFQTDKDGIWMSAFTSEDSTDKGFANARQTEIKEFVYKLE
ncbi:MAG: hypothetical protein ABI723_18790 [Bacteroidia bacterium]